MHDSIGKKAGTENKRVGLLKSSQITLRRDGDMPLRFEGYRVAHYVGASSFTRTCYSITLYVVVPEGYVTDIVLSFRQDDGETYIRRHRTIRAETLDTLASRLETHDPLDDLCPGISYQDLREDTSKFASMIEIIELLSVCREITLSYRSAIGMLLAQTAWLT